VWLKHISYAFTNRDLRDAYLEDTPVPEIYASCPYPQNITFMNLCYFWWAPTLVYQPVYPRSGEFRLSFFLKRVAEVIVLSLAMWFLTMQYAVPTLQNSVSALNAFNLPIILERLMKLSTVSLVIWLSGYVFRIFDLFYILLTWLGFLLCFKVVSMPSPSSSVSGTENSTQIGGMPALSGHTGAVGTALFICLCVATSMLLLLVEGGLDQLRESWYSCSVQFFMRLLSVYQPIILSVCSFS
jgi:hypothetical protein